MNQKQILGALAVVVLVIIGIVLYSRSQSDVASNTESQTNMPTESQTNDQATNANTNTETSTPTTPVTKEPTAPDGNDVQVFEIAFDGKAYTPSTLTIKNGDIVVFKNNSDKNFWPASARHPDHLEYPEFDPKKGIVAGQTWQFKFTKSGAWGFHDHLTPSAFGKITVQ